MKTNTIKKNDLWKMAEALGRQAFAEGRAHAPVGGPEGMNMIREYPGKGNAVLILKAWSQGWMQAMLDVPVFHNGVQINTWRNR
jgi:hypothetical protein